jgi:hypothetical protein
MALEKAKFRTSMLRNERAEVKVTAGNLLPLLELRK